MEGGGLAGLLVHVDAGLLQQLVGDQLVVEHNRDAEGGVLDTVDWKYISSFFDRAQRLLMVTLT